MRNAEFLPAGVTDIEFDPMAEEEKTDAELKADALADALKSDRDAFINVSRQTMGGNSPMEFVGRFPADKYDFGQLQVYLQERYGGGDYRLMLYANGKLRANKLISIARAQTVDKQSPGSMSELSNMLNAVLERQERQQQQMIQLMRQQRPEQNRMDMLREMMMYKELFSGNGNSSGNSLSQITETVSLLKDLGIGVGVGEKEDAGFGGLLKEMAPVFVAAAQGGNNQPSQQMPQQNPQPRQEKNSMNFMLQMGVQNLLRAASKNSNPATYAEMILDQLPEEVVREYVVSPEAISMLAKVDQRVLRYGEWFALLGEHVKAQLGMESSVSDQYSDDDLPGEYDSDITGENSQTPESPNVHTPDLSATANFGGTGGDS